MGRFFLAPAESCSFWIYRSPPFRTNKKIEPPKILTIICYIFLTANADRRAVSFTLAE